MNIIFDEKMKLFKLSCPEMEYAFVITTDNDMPGRLVNLH